MVIRSKYTVQVPPIPLHHALLAKFTEYGLHQAVVDGVTGQSYTYKDLEQNSLRIGSALTRLGARKGDMAAIYWDNCPEYMMVYYACLRIGLVLSGVNPVYTVHEMTYHMKDCKARFVFAMEENVSRTKAASAKAGTVRQTIVLGREPGCVSFDDLLRDDGSAFPEVTFSPREDVAVVPYSSGTTGLPKGVMLTHFNILANILQFSHEVFKNPDELESPDKLTLLSVVPFFHVYGLTVVMTACVAAGIKIITLPKFLPDKFLATIEKYKVTHLPLVPPLVVFLAKSPLVEKYDLSSIRKVNSGAASLAKDVEEEFKKRLKVPQMKQGYGMTETTTVATVSPATFHKPGSVGVLIPDLEARIVNPETKKDLGTGERGEIYLRGPNIMKGYLNKPKATAETVDADGWLHTGDVGYYDEDEVFYITGRLKELIKYKGFQVAPAELEFIILTHASVADAAVVGIPDPVAGELPRAFVVKKDDVTVTADDIATFVHDRVAPYKRLRGGVQFVKDIPKTPSGKIIRREVAKLMPKSKL